MIHGLFGLHAKFVISLLIAAALPFFIGLIFFETVGYRHMMAERGEMHEMEASSLVGAISQACYAEGEKLKSWLVSGPNLAAYAALKSRQMEDLPPIRLAEKIQNLDAIWKSLPASDPLMSAILINDAAESLASYQEVHHQAVELLITDAHGRLIAATSKTSDFNQADEDWWITASELPEGKYWRDAIHYDESSKVFVIGLAMPLYHDNAFAGVLKMGVEVSQLVPPLIMRGILADSSWYFVLRSGHVLASSDDQIRPLESRVPIDVLGEIKDKESGWTVGVDDQGDDRIMGFSALSSDDVDPNAYIVFSSLSKNLLNPLWGNFIALAAVGSSLLGMCLLAGFYIIQRKVLRPLARIEEAVRSVSLLARLQKRSFDNRRLILDQHQRVEDNLRKIQRIRTGDQMEVLAREISTMITRVLNYHSEVEIAERSRNAVPGSPGAEAQVANNSAASEKEPL